MISVDFKRFLQIKETMSIRSANTDKQNACFGAKLPSEYNLAGSLDEFRSKIKSGGCFRSI